MKNNVMLFEEFVGSLNEAKKEKTLTTATSKNGEDYIKLDSKLYTPTASGRMLDIDLFKNIGLEVPNINPINVKEIRDYFWDEINGFKHSIPRLGHEVWCRSVLAGWGKSVGESIDSIKKQMKYPELSDQELDSLVRERMNKIKQMISKADKTIENALNNVKWPDVMRGKISQKYDIQREGSIVKISPKESLDVRSKKFEFGWKAIPPREKSYTMLYGEISVVSTLSRGNGTDFIDQDYILNHLALASIYKYKI